MATFFGEILPTISRAVGDDDDDDDNEYCEDDLSSTAFLRWTPQILSEISNTDKLIACKTLIIAIGSAATSFVKTYVISHQETELMGAVWTGLSDQSANSLSQLSDLDESCFVHRLRASPSVIIVQCRTDVASKQAFSWTQNLFQKLQTEAAHIMVLTSQSGREAADTSDDQPVLRALKTDTFHGTPVCPYLGQPHTITGLAAQIMTYCQIHKLAAVLYTSYTVNIDLDLEAIKIFKQLLSATPLHEIVSLTKQEELNAEMKLQKVIELHSARNYIYI